MGGMTQKGYPGTAGRWSRVLLVAASLILSLGLLELASAWLYRIVNRSPFPREELLAKLDRRPLSWKSAGMEELAGLPQHMTNKVVHPFLGFVADPEQPGVNQHGFYGSEPLVKRSSESLNVVVLGGSVALDVFQVFREVFRKNLSETRFAGRELITVCLALDGYKQPQQLLALSYFLARGSEFDLVVNIDGFNEIALPYAENLVAGVDVFFPRSWHLFSRSLTSPGIAERVVEVHERKVQYEKWRNRFDYRIARRSNLMLMLWAAVERWKAEEYRRADQELRGLLRASPELPRELGPPAEYAGQEVLFRDLVRNWSESSRLMFHLARASGASFVHFLQPNQYLAGSKPFTELERTNAITPGPFRDAAVRGYPLLIEAGRELQHSGIPFWDLTGIFRDKTETLYIDNCCHFNEEGNRILAERMVAVILDELEK